MGLFGSLFGDRKRANELAYLEKIADQLGVAFVNEMKSNPSLSPIIVTYEIKRALCLKPEFEYIKDYMYDTVSLNTIIRHTVTAMSEFGLDVLQPVNGVMDEEADRVIDAKLVRCGVPFEAINGTFPNSEFEKLEAWKSAHPIL